MIASLFLASALAAPDVVATLKATIERSPSFENYSSLGMYYSTHGRNEEALEAFRKSLQISPSSPVAENNICAQLNSLHQWSEAIEHCRKALEQEPEFVLARNNLAFAERKRGSQDQEIIELQRSVASNRMDNAGRVNLGQRLFERGRYAEAITYWKGIPAESAHFAIAQNNIASALILTRRFKEAHAALDKAMKLQPENQLFKNNLAWLISEEARNAK